MPLDYRNIYMQKTWKKIYNFGQCVCVWGGGGGGGGGGEFLHTFNILYHIVGKFGEH